MAENPSVELGNPAHFVIAANQAPTTDQTINILVARANSEVSESTNEEIVLRAGADSTNYTVNTGSSEFLNANGIHFSTSNGGNKLFSIKRCREQYRKSSDCKFPRVSNPQRSNAPNRSADI